jgi:mono/diheme cytochrome c family protein
MQKFLPALFVFALFLAYGCTTPIVYNLTGEDKLPAQLYTIDLSRDTVLHTRGGAILEIPAGALDAGDSKSIQLEIKEAYTIEDIIRGGLVTRTNGQPLSSGGMIYINAAGGLNVQFKRPVTVSIPTDSIKDGMQLYKGKKDDKGKIDWTDPKPLAETPASKSLAAGKTLFLTKCASCHGVKEEHTGPALAFLSSRREKKWLYDFVHNNQQLMDSGDMYSRCLYEHYNRTAMNSFPNLSDAEIDQLFAYIDNETSALDSSLIPDYKRSVDSCVLYRHLVDSMEQQRARLIADNGVRTTVNWRDTAGNLLVGTHPLYTKTTPVTPEKHPAIYYKFTIDSFGWNNIDLLMTDLSGVVESELRVRVREEYGHEINIFLVIPSLKVLNEGGLLLNKEDEFGFLTDDGKMPLPQHTTAYVMAMGEYKGQVIFGAQPFVTARQQSLVLSLTPMTKEQMNAEIAKLSFDRLLVKAADSKNAGSIRVINAKLSTIERYKPRNCDCNCGLSDSESSGLPK